jgi:uncharacterized protein YecA (UPF0149 family)
MSSPLDSRMRAIAREEAGALLGVPGGAQALAGSAPTPEQMQQQITDLHEHLHHTATAIAKLEERVDSLEKEQPTVRRTPRKTGGTAAAPE